MHFRDPLANLSLTLAGMRHAYRRVAEIADVHAGGRLVVTGGGGYDPYHTVPRAWALAWEALSGRQLPAELPGQWRSQWAARLGVELPAGFADETAPPASPRSEAIANRNRSVAERLMAQLADIWGEGAQGVTLRS